MRELLTEDEDVLLHFQLNEKAIAAFKLGRIVL